MHVVFRHTGTRVSWGMHPLSAQVSLQCLRCGPNRELNFATCAASTGTFLSVHFYNPFCSSQSSRFLCFFFSVSLLWLKSFLLTTQRLSVLPQKLSWPPCRHGFGELNVIGYTLDPFQARWWFLRGWKSGIWWTKYWLVLRKEIVFLEDWDDADEVHPICIMVDAVERCCCSCQAAPPMRETSLILNHGWHIIARRMFRILNMFVRHGFATTTCRTWNLKLDWDGMHLATRPGRCGGAQWRWPFVFPLLWVRWQVQPHEIPARSQNHHWAAGKRDFFDVEICRWVGEKEP